MYEHIAMTQGAAPPPQEGGKGCDWWQLCPLYFILSSLSHHCPDAIIGAATQGQQCNDHIF